MLGAIVAALSNQSYYTYMKRLFRDAGMGDSGFFTRPQWRTDPTIAHPHHRNPEGSGWVDGLEEHSHAGLPAGGSFATCADMDRFAQVLMNNDLLGPADTSLMLGAKVPKSVGGAGEEQPGELPSALFVGYGSVAALFDDQWCTGTTAPERLGRHRPQQLRTQGVPAHR
ncbi:serine hydrolase [Actinomadura madurae]|uniref:serine hydrolase n=1 Tax=Actinomadura madurae TaxID=1993 RepID=UPI0024E20AF9|nr:serine hydrolase [Actinomadura madurae]